MCPPVLLLILITSFRKRIVKLKKRLCWMSSGLTTLEINFFFVLYRSFIHKAHHGFHSIQLSCLLRIQLNSRWWPRYLFIWIEWNGKRSFTIRFSRGINTSNVLWNTFGRNAKLIVPVRYPSSRPVLISFRAVLLSVLCRQLELRPPTKKKI